MYTVQPLYIEFQWKNHFTFLYQEYLSRRATFHTICTVERQKWSFYIRNFLQYNIYLARLHCNRLFLFTCYNCDIKHIHVPFWENGISPVQINSMVQHCKMLYKPFHHIPHQILLYPKHVKQKYNTKFFCGWISVVGWFEYQFLWMK